MSRNNSNNDNDEDNIQLLNRDQEIDTDSIMNEKNSNSISSSSSNSNSNVNNNMSTSTPQPPASSTSTILMVIGFYFFISISLVFLNKILMADLNFRYPLFITWYQQVVSFASIYIMSTISPTIPSLSFLPAFEFKPQIAKKVLPLTVVLTCMIIFNNLCLEYVEVSFYQVARSLTICFSIVLTYMILQTKTSSRATLACVIVFIGFILGSVGEVNFSWYGVFFGLLSSFFVALYSIYVKKVLPVCEHNEWRLSIYNTALSIGLILPLILISGEATTMFDEPIFYTGQFWVYMTLAGIMGYLISISIFMQIKHTSPLTNTISGTVKACVQTLLAIVFWGNEITVQNGFGILLVILGSFWYSYVRYMEMQRK
ncbi:hypothetical protein CYY_006455 [Polysphondylium violaceum]|uniref:Sugar phosphate transporter domain-containing protein n=1 Tax=Polysphondylium violaceum TaxID=133409 RepID=A0A8J4PRV7_9MYCE|nr:hypothetical protein CYY_006455 [Polysphondylium violaceum]